MTITLGWWALPALITLAYGLWMLWPCEGSQYEAELDTRNGLIAVLASWLIWALLA